MFYKSPFLFFIITVCLVGIFATGNFLSPLRTIDFENAIKYLDSDPVVKQFYEKYEMYGKIQTRLDDIAVGVDFKYQASDGKGFILLHVRTWAGIITSQKIQCTPDSNDGHVFYSLIKRFRISTKL